MQLPLVTIQIPTYNQKAYIREAVDSALAQSYENLQIIVSDDCSPDYDIFEYLKEYGNNPKVLIHRNEKNVGRVANYRNTLYDLVKGDWFVNLDGDDYFINPDFIKNAIACIQKVDFYPVIFQGQIALEKKIKSRHKEIKKIDENTYYADGCDYLQYYHEGNLGFRHASVLYRTDSAKEVGFYKYNTLDTDYWSYWKIMKKGYIIFSNMPTYTWRQHEMQATLTHNFYNAFDKYKALEDVSVFYSDTEKDKTKKMLADMEFNIFAELCHAFVSEEKTLRKTLLLMRKMKINGRYIIALLSKFKRAIRNRL